MGPVDSTNRGPLVAAASTQAKRQCSPVGVIIGVGTVFLWTLKLPLTLASLCGRLVKKDPATATVAVPQRATNGGGAYMSIERTKGPKQIKYDELKAKTKTDFEQILTQRSKDLEAFKKQKSYLESIKNQGFIQEIDSIQEFVKAVNQFCADLKAFNEKIEIAEKELKDCFNLIEIEPFADGYRAKVNSIEKDLKEQFKESSDSITGSVRNIIQAYESFRKDYSECLIIGEEEVESLNLKVAFLTNFSEKQNTLEKLKAVLETLRENTLLEALERSPLDLLRRLERAIRAYVEEIDRRAEPLIDQIIQKIYEWEKQEKDRSEKLCFDNSNFSVKKARAYLLETVKKFGMTEDRKKKLASFSGYIEDLGLEDSSFPRLELALSHIKAVIGKVKKDKEKDISVKYPRLSAIIQRELGFCELEKFSSEDKQKLINLLKELKKDINTPLFAASQKAFIEVVDNCLDKLAALAVEAKESKETKSPERKGEEKKGLSEPASQRLPPGMGLGLGGSGSAGLAQAEGKRSEPLTAPVSAPTVWDGPTQRGLLQNLISIGVESARFKSDWLKLAKATNGLSQLKVLAIPEKTEDLPGDILEAAFFYIFLKALALESTDEEILNLCAQWDDIKVLGDSNKCFKFALQYVCDEVLPNVYDTDLSTIEETPVKKIAKVDTAFTFMEKYKKILKREGFIKPSLNENILNLLRKVLGRIELLSLPVNTTKQISSCIKYYQTIFAPRSQPKHESKEAPKRLAAPSGN